MVYLIHFARPYANRMDDHLVKDHGVPRNKAADVTLRVIHETHAAAGEPHDKAYYDRRWTPGGARRRAAEPAGGRFGT